MTNNTNAPTEWVTVPREATEEMLMAAELSKPRGYSDLYRALIEAAPPAPEAGARRPLTDEQIKDGWDELMRSPRVPLPLFKHGVRWAELAHGIGGQAKVEQHRQGCDALGGYGNGVGPCSCGAVPQVEQPERKGVEWLPIATAPKDGTAVLVALPDCDVPHPARCHGTSGWHISWDGHELSEWEQPTHWQPLPAPPAGTNTTEG